MSRATVAAAALTEALRDTTPNCHGDDRFTDDAIDPATIEHLCMFCPLFDVCLEYARTNKPTGGIWAGKRWKPIKRSK